MSTPTWHERPTAFECEGDRLIGIVAQPEHPSETGVAIIVGGPQYRAGSHRQFTLLARQLAAQGVASIRFDYRGMGDSEGGMRNFEAIDADIRAAVNALMAQTPSIKKVVLWGLCDAASAALYYGPTDARVAGMVLLNPWVHTEAGAARARLKHYYLARLMSKTFWTKLLSGKVSLGESVGDLAKSAGKAAASPGAAAMPADPRHGSSGYIDRMLESIRQFKGEMWCILSGQDLTAQEFSALIENDKNWRNALRRKKIALETIADANHTFSSSPWREKVARQTCQWLLKKQP